MEFRVCHCVGERDGVCCQDRQTSQGSTWIPQVPYPATPKVIPFRPTRLIKAIEYYPDGTIKRIEYVD